MPDYTKRDVYLNARDCLYFGYGYKHLNKLGLTDEEAKVIWKQAFNDMASED